MDNEPALELQPWGDAEGAEQLLFQLLGMLEKQEKSRVGQGLAVMGISQLQGWESRGSKGSPGSRGGNLPAPSTPTALGTEQRLPGMAFKDNVGFWRFPG